MITIVVELLTWVSAVVVTTSMVTMNTALSDVGRTVKAIRHHYGVMEGVGFLAFTLGLQSSD